MRWKVVNGEVVRTTEHADEVNVFLSKSQAMYSANLVKYEAEDKPKKKAKKSKIKKVFLDE